MFQAAGGAEATTNFHVNDDGDFYFHNAETTIRPDNMFQIPGKLNSMLVLESVQ